MEVLYIVLNDLNYLDTILEKLVELKVRGATILDSEGMASALRHQDIFEILFSGPFQKSDQESYSKTIFSVIRDKEKLKNVIAEIRKIVSESKKNVIGFMFTVPVSGIYHMK